LVVRELGFRPISHILQSGFEICIWHLQKQTKKKLKTWAKQEKGPPSSSVPQFRER
jgi:hypothetical protein